MTQDELLQTLTGVKAQLVTVATELADTAAKLTETRTEVLAKLDELSNQNLSPEVQAIVDSLVATVSATKDAVDGIDAQATGLADIVPGSPAV